MRIIAEISCINLSQPICIFNMPQQLYTSTMRIHTSWLNDVTNEYFINTDKRLCIELDIVKKSKGRRLNIELSLCVQRLHDGCLRF